jgi:mannose-1-phosphate guanylyltransferase
MPTPVLVTASPCAGLNICVVFQVAVWMPLRASATSASAKVAVIEAPFAWDDVGSWQSLARTLGTDADGNTIVGKHLGLRTKNSIIRTTPDHLVATLGLADVIVVHTPDATLVASKHDEEAIRELVKELDKRGWREFL